MTATEASKRVLSWADVVDDASYYEILNVLALADDAAIKTAWHEFATAFHPDAHRGASPAVQEAATKVYMAGVEAYGVLSNAAQRSKYDLAVAKGRIRMTGDTGAPSVESRVVRSLDEVCRSAAARRHAVAAEDYIVTGDLMAAKKQLQIALVHDGGHNPDLEERIDALDLVLFASGD